MQRKLIDVLGAPKILGLTSLILAFLFGSGAIMAIASLVLKALRYTKHSYVFFLLDNIIFMISVLIILILPCAYFFKQFIRDLKISLFLNTILVNEDGFHIKQKEDLLYKWEDIEAINGKHESWRGCDIVIFFNDGKSIEIPIIPKAKEKTINFLKEVCRKSSQKTTINKLAEKFLLTEEN